MGLINWLRDKAFLTLEHDVRMMRTEIESINLQLESLKSRIASVRTMKSRRQNEEEEDSQADIDAIRKAFGGDLPIEFMQKYKNSNNEQ